MLRIALFVAGCITGYIASGYLEGLLDAKDDNQSPSLKRSEVES